ncbi:MAG: cytochrome c oxidase subunit II [Paracoccaceae bacterium]
MRFMTKVSGLATAAALMGSGAALAQQTLEKIGHPVPGGTGFQPAATELARDLHGLEHLILVIITVIVIFVTGLLIWCIVRFNKKANPTPATFTHNTPLEIGWTLIPVLVLFFIGAFSLPVLFKQQEIPQGDIVIKATGNQWYWSYEYVEDGAPVATADAGAEPAAPLAFDANMIGNAATNGEYRMTPEVEQALVAAGYDKHDFLLATDNAVVVPVGKVVVVQVTASDVIHSWTIPAFGVKQDGVPGRLAQLWFKAEREGIFFGQCSELCGKDHAFMPITVKVVSEPVYQQWLAQAKAGNLQLTQAAMDAATVKLASN